MTLELREVWWCWSLTLWHIKVMVSWSVDADVLEPSSPELIAPSPPPQTEPEPMQVDAAPVANDDSVEPQRMQRKLVSKTYVNEEGYMGQYWLVDCSCWICWYCVFFCRMMLCIAWTLLLIDVCLSITLRHCIKTIEQLAELFCFYTRKAEMPTFLLSTEFCHFLGIFLSSCARFMKSHYEESSKVAHFLSPNRLFQVQNVPKYVVGQGSTPDPAVGSWHYPRLAGEGHPPLTIFAQCWDVVQCD